MTKSNLLLSLSLMLSALAVTFSLLSFLVSMGVIFQGEETSFDRFEAHASSYLLNNPEVLEESMERHQARKAALLQNKDQIFYSQSSPVAGNKSGDITVVEFFDYNCPYCRRAEPILNAAVEADKGLQIVFKELPIRGPGSQFAARAALASQSQSKYHAFHQAMMTHRESLDEAATLEIARAVGLDINQLKRDMEAEWIKAELERNFKLAKQLRLTGTPTFIVGNKIVTGLVDLPTLQQSIASARQKARD